MHSDATRLIATTLLTGVILFACAGKPPTDLGVRDGRLAPCPATPNCVVSQGGDQRHHIDPITYSGEKTSARETLRQVILEMAGARIVAEERDYLHVEFISTIMRFVDDVEFFFPDAPVIHARSASRVGYSDLGVNRKRVETIRQRFQARSSEADRK